VSAIVIEANIRGGDVQGVTVSFVTVVVARLSICKDNEIASQLNL